MGTVVQNEINSGLNNHIEIFRCNFTALCKLSYYINELISENIAYCNEFAIQVHFQNEV